MPLKRSVHRIDTGLDRAALVSRTRSVIPRIVGPIGVGIGLALAGCGGNSTNRPPSPTGKPSTEIGDPRVIPETDQSQKTDSFSPPATAQNPLATFRAEVDISAKESRREGEIAPLAPTGTDALSDQPGLTPSVHTSSSPSPSGPTPGSHRLMVLAPRGPVICDVAVTVGGTPLDEGMTALIDDLLDRLGREAKTEPPTWATALESPILQSVSGAARGDMTDRTAEIRRSDSNQNGRIDADELRRYLTRAAGSASGFTVFSFNTYRTRNRDESALWNAIDSDRDGVLSSAERAEAGQRLRAWDSDRDGVVAPTDLPGALAVASDRIRLNEPPTVLAIAEGIDWDIFAANLSERYAFGGELTEDDLPLWPDDLNSVGVKTTNVVDSDSTSANPDASLDANQNGRLTKAELRGLTETTPRLRIGVAYDETDDDGEAQTADGETMTQKASSPRTVSPQGPRLTVAAAWPAGHAESAPLEPILTTVGGLARVELPGELLLLIRVEDAIRDSDVPSQAAALVAQADIDKDGTLSAEEFSTILPRVPNLVGMAADTDQNDTVTVAELEAALRLSLGLRPFQIRVIGSEIEDILLPWIDTDGDGRLAARELDAAADQSAKLDQNGDGVVRLDEVPECVTLLIERANDQAPARPAAIRFGPLRPTEEVTPPPWFAAMDSNRDGDLDSREFLGDAAQFDRLDQDHDGFITVAEATSEFREKD